MSTSVKKRYWAWEFEEQEKWLNKMCKQGKCLSAVDKNNYEFEDCEPEQYTLRMEMMKHSPESPRGQEYIAYMAEENAEYIGSKGKWVYFRKLRRYGDFDRLNDLTPKMRYLKLRRLIAGIVMVALFCVAVYTLFDGMINGNSNSTYLAIVLFLAVMFVLILVVQFTGAIRYLKSERKRVYGK